MPKSSNKRKNGKPRKSPQSRISGGKADKRDRRRLRGAWLDEAVSFVKKPFLRYNGYQCDKCKGMYVTVDLDEGTTPMFSLCLATKECTGTAHSLGYPDGPPEGYPVILEWYKPSPEELRTMSDRVYVHVNQGGLARRVSKEAPDWVKEKLSA